MIVCPNCQHKELPGALFCSECGAQLIGAADASTQSFGRIPTDQFPKQDIKIPATPVTPSTPVFNEAAISLYIVDAGQILPLIGREEFTIGRAAEGQPILPDIDLTPFRAYENGVSRLHITIKISPQEVVVMDLGSVNGTRLNGQKMAPNQTYHLKHGDIITLGKLKVQLLIRR
jgi:pSer/pThr/pTyr-binding forkhead associated (FHA) protein